MSSTVFVCGLFQDELAEQTLKAVCRKFSTSAKVWLRHISWLLTKDRGDAARKVMDKSFDVLPQRKHIKASVLPRPALPCPAPPRPAPPHPAPPRPAPPRPAPPRPAPPRPGPLPLSPLFASSLHLTVSPV